ncbi:MAG TPA: response regulator [Actinomycetota bacterium]|nr:response regulator [Actinomycetota bacterium]
MTRKRKQKRVLLIDDEDSMQGLVAMTLGSSVDVVHAANKSDALQIAGSGTPDLILLDLNLLDEDGIDVLPELRGQPSLETVPVVVFSVHESRRHEAMAAGADGFVSKPFSRAQILRELDPYLGDTSPDAPDDDPGQGQE